MSYLSRKLNKLASLATIFLISISYSGGAFSSLSETERGKSIEENLTIGKATWLPGGGDKFLALFTANQGNQPKGAAIILHDANSTANKPEVIRPLRSILPTQGWATLSIQLPQLESLDAQESHQNDVNSRIGTAIEYLQKNGISNIVLIGHGTGALFAVSYLNEGTNPTIRALVAISLGLDPKKVIGIKTLNQLEKVSVPMLDIFGNRDLPSVINSATNRSLAARTSSDSATKKNQIASFKHSSMATSTSQNIQGYIAYRQIKIDGADHSFSGLNQILSKRILGWLERHAKGVAVTASSQQ